MHNHSFSRPGTCSSIKSGKVKLVVWPENSFLSEIGKENTILEVFSTSTSYIECRQEQFWGDVIVYDLKYYHVILNLHLQSLSSMLLN